MNKKIVVLKIAAVQAHLTDAAVPLAVADLLKVREALGDQFDLQQFSVEVYEHAEEEAKLPGEIAINKERMH